MGVPSWNQCAGRCGAACGHVVFNQTFQADKSGDLDTVEVFKLEHYVAVVRREYMESSDRRNPSSMTQAQMKKAVSSRSTASYV